jgi:hypothetical protein
MYIEAIPCPRCAVPRTLRLGDGRSMCCNCKLQWEPLPPRTPLHAPDPDSLAYLFSPRERARLAVYRAAVQAGYYSDLRVGAGDTGRDGPLNMESVDLPAPRRFLFTSRELSRLAAYRAAIAAGLYSDQPRER